MKKDGSGIKVEYGLLPTSFSFDESVAEEKDAYPITVSFKHLTEEEATVKYISTGANGVGMRDGEAVRSIPADDLEERDALLDELRAKAGREEIVKAKYMIGVIAYSM